MPPLKFQHPDGRTITVDSPDGSTPSEQELDQLFNLPSPQPTQPTQEQPKGSSVLSKMTRMFMGSSPTESAKTIQEAGASVPESTPGEGLLSYLNKVKNTPALKQREESITSKGTLPQFSDVMQAGVLASGAAAPLKTAKMLGKFGALEGISQVTGLNKAIQGIQQPDIRDVADITKFGAQGALANKRWLPKPNRMKLAGEATAMYRTMLRPNKGEIDAVEVKSGKKIDNFYKLASEEGLPIERGLDKNSIDTVKARELLEPKQEALHERLNKALRFNPEKRFNLMEIGDKVKQELRGRIKNDTDYKTATKQVDEYIGDAIEARGQLLNGEELNNFKQGMWSASYDPLKPNSNKVARQIGRVSKEMIESGYKEKSIQKLNKQSGDYAVLHTLLKNAQGRVVKGGKMGNYFARTIGAVAGTKVPVVGPLAGAYLGGKASEYLNNPERISRIATKKAKIAGSKE